MLRYLTRGKKASFDQAATAIQAAIRGMSARVNNAKSKSKKGSRGKGNVDKVAAAKVNARQGGTKTKVEKKKRKSKKKLTVTQGLKKDVKRLKKAVLEKPTALFVFKSSITNQVLHAANECGYADYVMWDLVALEEVLNAVPYQAIATPQTTATTDLTAATRNQKVPMRVFTKIWIKNNHNMPFDLDYYVWVPKTDFALSGDDVILEVAEDLAKSGIANVAAGDALYNNPTIYPSDSPLWRQIAKVEEHKKVRLEPGDEITVSSGDYFTYNQEYRDEHATSITKFMCKHILLRSMGVPSHDETTTTNVGLSDGGYDWVMHRRYEVISPSDIKTLNYEISNGYDAMAVAPTITGPNTGAEKEEQ